MSLQIVQPGQTRTRKRRSPSFNMAGSVQPFGLYPLMATPVLPGETLQDAEMKIRMISLPVNHPMVGAWFETWLCFVSLTDMRDEFAEMFIREGVTPPAGVMATADNPRYFVKTGSVDYIRLATEAVYKAFFQDAQEVAPAKIDGVPRLRRSGLDWAQNLMFKPDALDPAYLPSELPDDGTYTALEIMRMSGMSEMTYEKYLAQYGVSQKKQVAEARLPEILRYTRSWTLPTNHIDPASGAPSSAYSWSETIKAEKAKRFDEPGFLIWLGALRPKMYDKRYQQSLIGKLWGFGDWFPVYNLEDPSAGLKILDPGVVNSAAALTKPLMYDHRDLLSRGEQFVNNWAGPYNLPTTNPQPLNNSMGPQEVRALYPSDADAKSIFAEALKPAGNQNPKRFGAFYEGICAMTISGHVVDTTR